MTVPPPPSGLVACLTSEGGGCATEGGDRPVLLNWQEPHLAIAVRYFVYRFGFAGETFTVPTTLPTDPIGSVEPPVEGVLPTIPRPLGPPNA